LVSWQSICYAKEYHTRGNQAKAKTVYRFVMKGTQLGEFEELVLLTIALLYNDAYSVAVVEELGQRLERPMSLGAVHRTMQRLEEKGLVIPNSVSLLPNEEVGVNACLP
jgi:hypothetical protein